MNGAGDASEAPVQVRSRPGSRAMAGLATALTRGSTTKIAASASFLTVLAILLIGVASLPQSLLQPSLSSSMAYRALVASAVLGFTGIWLSVAVVRYIRPSSGPHGMG